MLIKLIQQAIIIGRLDVTPSTFGVLINHTIIYEDGVTIIEQLWSRLTTKIENDIFSKSKSKSSITKSIYNPVKYLPAFNAMLRILRVRMATCVDTSDLDEAVSIDNRLEALIEQMDMCAVDPDLETFVDLLWIASWREISSAKELMTEKAATDQIPISSISGKSAGYVTSNAIPELIADMQSRGIKSAPSTFAPLINLMIFLKDTVGLWKVMEVMKADSCRISRVMWIDILQYLDEMGDLESIRRAYQDIMQEAKKDLKAGADSLTPNTFLMNIILQSILRSPESPIDAISSVISAMSRINVMPNRNTYHILITALSTFTTDLESIKEVVRQMEETEDEATRPNRNTFMVLIEAYRAIGIHEGDPELSLLEEAAKDFDRREQIKDELFELLSSAK